MSGYKIKTSSRVFLSGGICSLLLFHGTNIRLKTRELQGRKQDTVNIVYDDLVKLENDFAAKAKLSGKIPRRTLPPINMDNPPSFGNYDDSLNILHSSDWVTMPEEQKKGFEVTAQGIGPGWTGQRYFEIAVHKWVFVHELGHWWRAAQNVSEPSAYQEELGANRIDVAYWRQSDTAYLSFMEKRFSDIIKNTPNPVPAGSDPEKFLNDNYGKLPIPAYIWFQAKMIIDAINEMPKASFKQMATVAGRKG